MIKWIAVAAFVLALAASAKAMTAQPKVQAEGLTTPLSPMPVGRAEFVSTVSASPELRFVRRAVVCGGTEAFAPCGGDLRLD